MEGTFGAPVLPLIRKSYGFLDIVCYNMYCMSDITKTKVDLAKIKKAVQVGIPLSITTYTFPHEAEVYVSEVISAFFHEINQENMTEYIIYSMNELITNAKKANTKRIYFK